jgi:hypothetical protein
MTSFHPAPYLRQGLLANATTQSGFALLMLIASTPLARRLGIPAPLLFYAGLGLIPVTLLIGSLALSETLRRPVVWAVILFNLLFAFECLALMAGGWIEPTRAGIAFLGAQGAVAAMYAVLQCIGLQRSAETAA